MAGTSYHITEPPRSPCHSVGTPPDGQPLPRSATSFDSMPPAAPGMATIVVIDDSATALTLVSQWLEDSGHRVVPLPRALGATTTLLHVHPDVLLLDVQMPGLSGDRFARVLAQSPTTASIPIIFHSQLDPSQLKRLAQECSVIGAIPKTTSRNAFLREFNKLAGPFLHEIDADPVAHGPAAPDPLDIGVAELDVQRHHVKRLASRIADNIREARAHEERLTLRQQLRSSLLELLVFMRYHLATEDRYLRSHGCPSIGEHRQRHEAYLDESMALERKVDLNLPMSDLVDSARKTRLLALEHLWGTDADVFHTH